MLLQIFDFKRYAMIRTIMKSISSGQHHGAWRGQRPPKKIGLPSLLWLAPHVMILKPSLPFFPTFSSSKYHKYKNYDKAPYIVSSDPQSPGQTNSPRHHRHTNENLLNCTFSKSLDNN